MKGRVKNQATNKVDRSPKTASQLTRLELVVYELISYHIARVGESPSSERVQLRSLQARIAPGMVTASATEVAQYLADEDNEELEDGP